MKHHLWTILLLFFISDCSDEGSTTRKVRDYKMGFTTWSYGPTLDNVNSTYSFIANHSDIYAEHIDNRIPWNSWINGQTLPSAFVTEINGRVQRSLSDQALLLSVSLLNSNRDELASDYDGSTPPYTMNDPEIIEAYIKHISHLLDQFNPDYLVIAIEVNELLLRAPDKWDSYKILMTEVKSRIRQTNPNLKISESISLHNLYEADISNPQSHIDEIMNYVNDNDFTAISFYPFLKNLNTAFEFQEALDFLHLRTPLPIAFVETAHIAENLEIPNLDISIYGNEQGQNIYLQTLIENAISENYEFIIWWAHRDYDALWETFPEDLSDLGRIWRDTGLLDEEGKARPAFFSWMNNL